MRRDAPGRRARPHRSQAAASGRRAGEGDVTPRALLLHGDTDSILCLRTKGWVGLDAEFGMEILDQDFGRSGHKFSLFKQLHS